MRWGFIGCGNLAQALIVGAIQKKILSPSQILVNVRDIKKIKSFIKKTGISLCVNKSELVERCDVIILATKPQDLTGPLRELRDIVTAEKTVISLAAGIDAQTLNSFLGRAGGLIRVMGNTPAKIQKAVFGIHFIRHQKRSTHAVVSLFESLGSVVLLKKDKDVDAFTAGGGSGVGFVFMLMEEFERWFKRHGFSEVEARQVVVETFLGAASLAQFERAESLRVLREKVSSKKGTTLAGLKQMKKSNVPRGIQSGLTAALRRAQQMSRINRNLKK